MNTNITTRLHDFIKSCDTAQDALAERKGIIRFDYTLSPAFEALNTLKTKREELLSQDITFQADIDPQLVVYYDKLMKIFKDVNTWIFKPMAMPEKLEEFMHKAMHATLEYQIKVVRDEATARLTPGNNPEGCLLI